jgi:hypothetical protein
VYQKLKRKSDGSDECNKNQFLFDLFLSLLREHWRTVGVLFGKDPSDAATEIIKVRDYVVHRDNKLGKMSHFDENLYWLTQKLMCLMKACLLTELAIAEEDQLKLFRKNEFFVHLLGLKQ